PLIGDRLWAKAHAAANNTSAADNFFICTPLWKPTDSAPFYVNRAGEYGLEYSTGSSLDGKDPPVKFTKDWPLDTVLVDLLLASAAASWDRKVNSGGLQNRLGSDELQLRRQPANSIEDEESRGVVDGKFTGGDCASFQAFDDPLERTLVLLP